MHIFCYKYTHLKRQKSITMTAANPTQRSGDSHTQKNCTCKRRIHDFYVFCIDECKAIILASGTINCYCCCCCCILMSRYIFKRGVEVTVFLIPGMAMSPLQKYGGDLYTICIQKVYTNLLYCTFCILDVYIKKKTGNVIDLHVFFFYTAVKGCVQKVHNSYEYGDY